MVSACRSPSSRLSFTGDNLQLPLHRQQGVRFKAQQGAKLEPEDLDLALEDLAGGIQAVHFDQHQVLVKRRGTASAHALPNEAEGLPVCRLRAPP